MTTMYCTLEEAWGHDEVAPAATTTPPPAPRRKKKSRHKSTSRRAAAPPPAVPPADPTESFADFDGGATYDGGWAQSLPPTRMETTPSPHPQPQPQPQPHPNPDTLTHNTFSKAPTPSRVPDGVDVTLDAAPFDAHATGDYDGERGGAGFGPTATRTLALRAPPLGEGEGEGEESAEDEEGASLALRSTTHHDELQWMRNNLSHLGSRIDRLTETLLSQQRAAEAQAGVGGGGACAASTWSEQLFDVVLYLVAGLFVLFLLDMCYRAGERSLGRGYKMRIGP